MQTEATKLANTIIQSSPELTAIFSKSTNPYELIFLKFNSKFVEKLSFDLRRLWKYITTKKWNES